MLLPRFTYASDRYMLCHSEGKSNQTDCYGNKFKKQQQQQQGEKKLIHGVLASIWIIIVINDFDCSFRKQKPSGIFGTYFIYLDWGSISLGACCYSDCTHENRLFIMPKILIYRQNTHKINETKRNKTNEWKRKLKSNNNNMHEL